MSERDVFELGELVNKATKPKRKRKQKKWRKEWQHNDADVTRLKISNIIDMINFGRVDENWHFKKVTLKEALEITWVQKALFYYHIRQNPTLGAKYEDTRLNRREALKDKAEDNLMWAMEWTWDFADMEWKDRARLSLDILKQTDKAYNPRTEIDAKIENLNFDIPMEDMEKMILELIR